jgi:outer membrane lipoprotein LolB
MIKKTNITRSSIASITSILFFVLTSCAPPHLPDDASITSKNTEAKLDASTVKKQIRAAKYLTSWSITGAVAAKNKRKTWTASLNWKQQGPSRYQIRLFGPLGGGSVLVEKKGARIAYHDGSKHITTTNIDQLFYKETGVRIPLHNLYYWVRGVQAPGAVTSSQHDAQGYLTTLTQAGYTIQYENYRSVQGFMLPTKLRVSGPGGSLKLVIKQWEIHG